ncbi:MAG: hypothetical protein RL291_379 [Pseudomonadota bacterium]
MVQSDKVQSYDLLRDKTDALLEASYLAGFAMVGEAGPSPVDDAVDDPYAINAVEPLGRVNPWHMGRMPQRKRWAREAIEAFARRLDEVSARPRPLTKTAVVVWQPPAEQPSWLSSMAATAKSYVPRMPSLPFTRHTSA